MNPLVESIYRKAWKETTDHHATMQRFAELIVRECAFVAQNKDAHKDWLKYGRALAADKILEHFGY